MMKKRIPPALALWVIAPVFGELFSGSTPLNEFINPIGFLFLAFLYGSGAILIREAVVRWGKGWKSLLLLGFAYGIYEEGLVVRSFFDPAWPDLGSMATYGRVWGVNWVWVEHLTIYHALISIAASITFTEMLYPEHRTDPWLSGRKWYLANWAAFLLMLPIGKLLTPYDAPDGWVALTWLVILALVGLARLLPSAPPSAATNRRDGQVPRPRRFFLTGLFGMFLQFFFLYLGADEGLYPFPVTMLLLLLYDLFVLWLVRRWSDNGTAWDDRHRLALVLGALSFFLLFAPPTIGEQYPIVYFSNPVFLILLYLAYRKVRTRVEREVTLSPSSP
ncbi:MAG: hypothetical protein D6770_03145 [Anaerolineae bacterium]|nr:MAG: hypothetical protein D6770_03145 [Anaerolineae bacterium]